MKLLTATALMYAGLFLGPASLGAIADSYFAAYAAEGDKPSAVDTSGAKPALPIPDSLKPQANLPGPDKPAAALSVNPVDTDPQKTRSRQDNTPVGEVAADRSGRVTGPAKTGECPADNPDCRTPK